MERRGTNTHSSGSPPNRLQGMRILLVEDEVVVAMELRASFEDHGACVIGPRRTVRSAIEGAEEPNLSAAVLDVRIGGESIAPVARRLAERGTPFLFYTGESLPDWIRAEWPAAEVISKPAMGRQLVEAAAKLGRAARQGD